MKITVYSRGTAVIDADAEWQEPQIREAIEDGCNDVASTIIGRTYSERSDISHDDYAIVTEDDGTVLWRGWLTGDPEAAPPAEAAQARDTSVPSELDILRARAEAVRAHCEAVAKGVREDLGIPVRAQDVRLNAGDILRILDGEPAPAPEVTG